MVFSPAISSRSLWEMEIIRSYLRPQRRQCQSTPVLLPGKSHGRRSLVGCSPWGLEESDTTERLHFHFYALEKEMATHSSVLAWRIPWMAEPGGLPSMGSHRVSHDRSNLAAAAAATPDLPSQNLWGWGPAICMLTAFQRIPVHNKVWNLVL